MGSVEQVEELASELEIVPVAKLEVLVHREVNRVDSRRSQRVARNDPVGKVAVKICVAATDHSVGLTRLEGPDAGELPPANRAVSFEQR